MARLLLSAYACEPDKGSEPAVGWMWAVGLSFLGHDVWVITRETNREAIEQAFANNLRPGLQFVYCDLPVIMRRWKRGPWSTYLYYWLWQWIAYRTARKLVRNVSFDAVQHVTFVSLRAPSFMGRLGIPFYFGPVSGGERVPVCLRWGWSFRAQMFELLRDAANCSTRFDPFLRSTFQRAARIYLASLDTLRLIPPHCHAKCRVQLAIGLTREYLGWTSRNPLVRGSVLRIFYAGRLLEWKGLDLGVRALQVLQARGVRAEFTIVGEGPARSRLEHLADQLGVSARVQWVPWLRRGELEKHFRRNDVFLYPSLRDSGGMVVLEALAHGLPVVCTDIGGPGEIVTEQCGRRLTTHHRNSNDLILAFADALCDLALNPGLRGRLAIGARRRAWDFDFGKVVAQIYSSELLQPCDEEAEFVS